MANYAIMRIEKRKLGAVGRICNHHERLKAEYKSNPDIDPSRTHLNYHIVEPAAKYRKAVLDRIEEVGAKRRKDSVVMQDCFVGGTPDWLKGKSVEEQREYFDYAYRFFENNFKKENIISAVVHLDEATPHMHLCFVPITEKGRLSSKDIIGGPKGLVGWQDKFYEYMHEKYPDITRGTPAKVSHRKHIPPFMFKVAGELYDHYGEICGAINDIGLVNNAKKKDAAIHLGAVLRDDHERLWPLFQNVHVHRTCACSAFRLCRRAYAEHRQELPEKLCVCVPGGSDHRSGLHHLLRVCVQPACC